MNARKLFMMLAALVLSASTCIRAGETVVTIDGLRYMFSDGARNTAAIFCGIADGAEFRDLVIPSSVSYNGSECIVYRIERGALSGHSELRSVRLPETILQISDKAFNGCSSLIDFNIPGQVKLLGSEVFDGTAWMDRQPDGIVMKDNAVISWKGPSPADGELRIEDGARLIAKQAFCKKAQLPTLHIPASIREIGEGAFQNCGLRELYLETPVVEGWFRGLPVRKVVLCEGVREVTPQAFGFCSMLQEVVFPASLEYLSSTAFSQTAWFLELRRESTDVIYIGDIAFTYGLKVPEGATLKVREGTRVIAGSAFSFCKSVSSVEVPEGVQVIGEQAFWCSNLRSIRLPSTLSDIRKDALSAEYTPAVISDITAPADLAEDTFSDVFVENARLTVPANTSALYRQREGWRRFRNISERTADGIQTAEAVGTAPASTPYFDLSGRRLMAPPAKGMYIENGRKIIK